MGSMKKVLVSFDEALLRQIDSRAEALGLSRSAYLSSVANADIAPGSEDRRSRIRASIERARETVARSSVPDDWVDVVTALRQERNERLRKLGGDT